MNPLPAEDVRGKGYQITLRATTDRARIFTAIRTQADKQGISPAGLARNILLDAAGYTSTTRRKSTSRSKRPRTEGGPAGLWVALSADEHHHITQLAADSGTTITDWAVGVLEQAMKPQRGRRQDASG